MDLPSAAQPSSPEIEFLYGLRGGRTRLGLESTRRLLRCLGSPQKDLVILQVAGTNGKGTTTAVAAALLQAAGLRVGRFTSPHLMRVEERLCIDGAPIAPAEFRRRVRDMRPCIERAGASFFEAITAMAAMHFRDHGVDAAVFEVGLGGRLDSTTALPAAASIVTGVSFDHEAILGDTLAAILGEKLGIARAGVPLFTGLQEAPLVAQAQAHCDATGAPLHVLPDDVVRVHQVDPHAGMRFDLVAHADWSQHSHRDLRSRFLGEHQARNAALALRAVEHVLDTLSVPMPPQVVSRGMAQAFLAGRFQLLPATARLPETLVDVAHNQQSLLATLDLAQRFFPGRRPTVVLGVLGDKRIDGVYEQLGDWIERLVLTSPQVPRAWNVDDAATRARAVLPDSIPIEVVPRVAAAVRRAHECASDLLLILGSHYLAAEALPGVARARGVTPRTLLWPQPARVASVPAAGALA